MTQESLPFGTNPDPVNAFSAQRQATLQVLIDEVSRQLNENREELIKAFLAKYGCDPADAILCITREGSSFIRKMTKEEIEFRDLVARRAQEEVRLGSDSPRSAASTATSSGEALRNRGLARVSNNNKEWMQKCLAHFQGCVFHHPFTGEDVRRIMEKSNFHPSHPNAWGALINALVRKKLIVATGEYRTPKDKASHARQQKVYRRA